MRASDEINDPFILCPHPFPAERGAASSRYGEQAAQHAVLRWICTYCLRASNDI